MNESWKKSFGIQLYRPTSPINDPEFTPLCIQKPVWISLKKDNTELDVLILPRDFVKTQLKQRGPVSPSVANISGADSIKTGADEDHVPLLLSRIIIGAAE